MKYAMLFLVLLTGCGTTGSAIRYGEPLPETDPHDVQVLYKMPTGATVIGEVEGVETLTFGDDAIWDARELAAGLGADAIVIKSTGTQLGHESDIFRRRVDTLQATAIKFR
jgi:hypothetical protein